MSLKRLLVGAHVIETSGNYARADDPLQRAPLKDESRGMFRRAFGAVTRALHRPAPPAEDRAGPPQNKPLNLDDARFWEAALHDPAKLWYRQFVFNQITVSEWVARIPGLGFSKQAVRLRNNAEHVERLIGGYRAYDPPVKSEFVMSGVGTLRLSPGNDGSALVTLSTIGDASLGVPALMSPEVLDRVQRDGSLEGCVISGSARWLPMAETWAANFPIIRGLPRGYLLLDKPADITVMDERRSTQIYPFTVMQYEEGASELFDYVYAGARTDDRRHRKQLEDFFASYQKAIGGQARYLFNGDMVQPLWDAEFASPAELRRNDPGAPSQLRLLEARVRERQLGKADLEQLLQRMGELLGESDARVISDEIGIPYATWYIPGITVADLCNLLVDAAIQRDRVEALVQAVAIRQPQVYQ